MKSNIDLAKIKKSTFDLLESSGQQRNLFLKELRKILIKSKEKILLANKKDLKKAKEEKLTGSFIERLALNEKSLQKIIERVNEVKRLKSGAGEVIEERITKDGLKLQKIRVPLGVILIIYEARPEVTIDVAALCIKSGNACILKGGSEALVTNKVLYQCIVKSLLKSKLPLDSITFIEAGDRKVINNLLKRNDSIDLVIARGSYKMVKAVQGASKIPVLAHSAGGARIYIDKSANLSIVEKIILNAKISKPSAFNSLDTILIHEKLRSTLLPIILKSLKKKGIEIVKNKWDKEFLDLKVSIKVVKNIDEAIEFINKYSKKHSEGIIAKDKKIIKKFTASVDAAGLFVNCSPRLHDGYFFGLGSEMGIATGKFHARGPVGLKELTIYKWIVYGKSNIRK